MQYLIKIPGYTPPYRTSLAFIAHDFRQRGFYVSEHADDSPYMTEIRYREQKLSIASTRPRLIELWAKEIMKQPTDYTAATNVLSPADTRLDRISKMVQDFIQNIATFGKSVPPTRIHWWSPKYLRLAREPLPKEPGLNLAILHLRLLHSIGYTTNQDSGNRQRNIVDSIIFRFRHKHIIKPAPLAHALAVTGAAPGRLNGQWVRDEEVGIIQVQMFVDVSDCVALRRNRMGVVGESLPRYDGDEMPPAYEQMDRYWWHVGE